MPPLPKRNPARRNVSATKATLSPDHDVEAPPLPDGIDWLPMTRDWWADIWASPMAPEYDQSDIHGLYRLAALIDRFWHMPSKDLSSEIRMTSQSYGLSPLDRRRLQWEIERSEDAQDKGRRRRGTTPPPPEANDGEVQPDPRNVLRLVV